MNLRSLNEAGISRLHSYVAEVRSQSDGATAVAPPPVSILSDSAHSTVVHGIQVPEPPSEPFESKRALAEFLCSFLPAGRHEELIRDHGVWSWLAVWLFDSITNERTKIKEPRAYVAGLGYTDFYRHLLLGPYFLYTMAKDNPSRVQVLLYDDPTTMNEVLVQFGSYQTLMQNPDLQSVIGRLYYDESQDRIKRGAGGKGKGSPRRLMDFFRQLEVNYDLRRMGEAQFWGLLPNEFQSFKT